MNPSKRSAFSSFEIANRGFWLLVVLTVLVVLSSCGSNSPTESTVSRRAPSSVQKAEETKPLPAKAEEQPPPVATKPSASESGGDTIREASVDRLKSLTFDPEHPVTGQRITAKISFEENVREPLSLHFRWTVNGSVVRETPSPELEHATRKGDQIELAVFVGDTHDETRAIRGAVMVENSPPILKKLDERLTEKDEYVARLESSDPDGDPVTLTLQKGPQGLTLDTSNALVRWPVPKGTKGNFPVEIVGRDTSGAQAILSYSITLK